MQRVNLRSSYPKPGNGCRGGLPSVVDPVTVLTRSQQKVADVAKTLIELVE